MPILEESWQPLADTLGFPNEREMLNELYLLQRLSLSQIAKVLGVSHVNVRRRLLGHGIPLRARGGRNRTKRILADVPSAELFSPQVNIQAYQRGIHPSTIFAERRRRRDELRTNLSNTVPGEVREDEVSHGSSAVLPDGSKVS